MQACRKTCAACALLYIGVVEQRKYQVRNNRLVMGAFTAIRGKYELIDKCWKMQEEKKIQVRALSCERAAQRRRYRQTFALQAQKYRR